MNMLKIIAVPIHKEGSKFGAIFTGISVLLGLLWEPLFWLGTGATVCCYYYLRDPVRITPQDGGLVISPADSVVSLIGEVVPPATMGFGNAALTRVSAFPSVFNCHVNRAPVAGTMTNVVFQHGKFVNASPDKPCEHNERNSLTVDTAATAAGARTGVVQIAGFVARRIVCFLKEIGVVVTSFRFGSRLDIHLPTGIAPLVMFGQTAVSGETILAERGADTPRMGYPA